MFLRTLWLVAIIVAWVSALDAWPHWNGRIHLIFGTLLLFQLGAIAGYAMKVTREALEEAERDSELEDDLQEILLEGQPEDQMIDRADPSYPLKDPTAEQLVSQAKRRWRVTDE